MSDFLRNLRSSHQKESSNKRKNLDGHYYSHQDRRKIKDRRPYNSNHMEGLVKNLTSSLPGIVDNINSIAIQMKELNEMNEILAQAMIGQHEAITTFFNNLNKVFDDTAKMAKDNGGVPKATTSYARGTHYTKDEILTIIKNMRTQGSTFSIIASYLKEKGIPTFSGRGEWHAQTIHRLCR
ncbi:MAG: hypothetical protein GY729_03585 [Desulfobacteraceae bacterium]|nr:hypothetical protein [Desulfobacteraceae bacterium]